MSHLYCLDKKRENVNYLADNFLNFEDTNLLDMSDNYFEGSTAAMATIFTIVALGIITSILIWG